MDIQALLCDSSLPVMHDAFKLLDALTVPKPSERLENLEDLLQASILLSHVKETGLLDMREQNACRKHISHVVSAPRSTLASCASTAGNNKTNLEHFFADTSCEQSHTSCPHSRHLQAHADMGDCSAGLAPAGAGSSVVDVHDDVCVRLFPRRKAGSAEPESHKRDPVKLSFDMLAPMFGLPQSLAAKSIGVSLTALKQVSRKLGLARWPYRRASKSHALHKISHKTSRASNPQRHALSSSGSAESIVTQTYIFAPGVM